MEIAKYTIGTSIVFPQSEMARFDAQLRILESKMKTSGEKMKMFFNLNLSKFSVNQSAMNRVLGNALDVASATTVFRIERFIVDQSRLNMALGGAMAKASAVATVRTSGGAGTATKAAATGSMIGGGLSRFYGPALALGLGGYGLGSLNKRNQEVVASQLQSSAVIQQQGGTPEQGKQSFEWLRNQANDIGFNYLKASPEYNNLLANMTGSGFSVKQGQDVFKSFAELSRTYKLGSVQQQRVFLALSQIAGKGQLQSQELKLQLGQALPGAEGLFATAYQNMTGGKLTGQKSIAALLDAMKKGKVSADILNYVSPLVHEKAVAGGLETAKKASAGEQARYENAVSNLAVTASDSGVEEGFARIFRTLTAGLSESNGLVRTLAEGFNEATKWADDLLLFPQSFVRALEGKDSLVADWLGIDKSSQLVQDWKTIQEIFTNIGTIKFDFLPTLESTAREIAMILNQIAEFQRWKDNLVSSPNQEQDVSFWQRPITATYQTIGKFFNGAGDAIDRSKERGRAVYDDPNSFYYQNPALYDDNQKNMAMDMATAGSDYKLTGEGSVTNQFDISINIDPATMGNIDVQSQAEDLMNRFKIELSNASVNFPVKE